MKNVPINWPTVAVVALLLLFFTMRTGADPVAPASPAVVAIVDLERAINGSPLQQRRNEELKALGQELDSVASRLRDDVEMLNGELEILPPGSQGFLDMERSLLWKAHEHRAYAEYAGRRLEAEKAYVLRQLYIDVRRVVRAIAEENGYDVVLVNDSVDEVLEGATEDEVRLQISARRVLYSNQMLDITDLVKSRLK